MHGAIFPLRTQGERINFHRIAIEWLRDLSREIEENRGNRVPPIDCLDKGDTLRFDGCGKWQTATWFKSIRERWNGTVRRNYPDEVFSFRCHSQFRSVPFRFDSIRFPFSTRAPNPWTYILAAALSEGAQLVANNKQQITNPRKRRKLYRKKRGQVLYNLIYSPLPAVDRDNDSPSRPLCSSSPSVACKVGAPKLRTWLKIGGSERAKHVAINTWGSNWLIGYLWLFVASLPVCECVLWLWLILIISYTP